MVSTHFTDLSKHTIAYSEIDYVASLRVISQKTLHKIKEWILEKIMQNNMQWN